MRARACFRILMWMRGLWGRRGPGRLRWRMLSWVISIPSQNESLLTFGIQSFYDDLSDEEIQSIVSGIKRRATTPPSIAAEDDKSEYKHFELKFRGYGFDTVSRPPLKDGERRERLAALMKAKAEASREEGRVFV